MSEKDLYVLGIIEGGKEVLLVYKATHEEAEQHGRQFGRWAKDWISQDYRQSKM